MKVGIITWFQYENYGTKLQALALQAFLRNEGYDTQLINYEVPEVSQTFKKNTLISRLFDKIKYILLQRAKRLFSSQLKIRSLRMKQVISDYCVLSPHIASDEEYVKICNQFDIIICGSDQIWNPNWYHRYYYADFPEIHVKKVSYAPSLGINKIPEQIVPLMKKSLASFSRITVREENAIDLLEPLIGYRPQKVIDPTMLFSGQQ